MENATGSEWARGEHGHVTWVTHDNKADIKSLMSIGWKPKIKLYDYLDRYYG